MWFANLRDTDVQETARSAKFLLSSKAQRLSCRAPWVPSPTLRPTLCHANGDEAGDACACAPARCAREAPVSTRTVSLHTP